MEALRWAISRTGMGLKLKEVGDSLKVMGGKSLSLQRFTRCIDSRKKKTHDRLRTERVKARILARIDRGQTDDRQYAEAKEDFVGWGIGRVLTAAQNSL